MATLNDVSKMVTMLFPDAIPGEDFRLEVRGDGDLKVPAFSYWNTAKLGMKHSIPELHEVYMRFIGEINRVNPSEPLGDPLPELTERREKVLRMKQERAKFNSFPEVVDGVVLTKVVR